MTVGTGFHPPGRSVGSDISTVRIVSDVGMSNGTEVLRGQPVAKRRSNRILSAIGLNGARVRINMGVIAKRTMLQTEFSRR